MPVSGDAVRHFACGELSLPETHGPRRGMEGLLGAWLQDR